MLALLLLAGAAAAGLPCPPAATPSSVAGDARCAPAFAILGTYKGGTTSAFSYLVRHPQVVAPREPPASKGRGGRTVRQKELIFFSEAGGSSKVEEGDVDGLRRGYEELFPEVRASQGVVTGEASPEYLTDASAARRLAAAYPEMRLVVLLRDPVERTFSQDAHDRSLFWGRQAAMGRRPFEWHEPRTLERTVVSQSGHVASCMSADDDAESVLGCLRTRGRWGGRALANSMYGPQLEAWLAAFPRSSFLFLLSEDLYEDTAATMARIGEFLGLDPFDWESVTHTAYNVGVGGSKEQPEASIVPAHDDFVMPRAPRADWLESRLADFFAETRDTVAELTGLDTGRWQSGPAGGSTKDVVFAQPLGAVVTGAWTDVRVRSKRAGRRSFAIEAGPGVEADADTLEFDETTQGGWQTVRVRRVAEYQGLQSHIAIGRDRLNLGLDSEPWARRSENSRRSELPEGPGYTSWLPRAHQQRRPLPDSAPCYSLQVTSNSYAGNMGGDPSQYCPPGFTMPSFRIHDEVLFGRMTFKNYAGRVLAAGSGPLVANLTTDAPLFGLFYYYPLRGPLRGGSFTGQIQPWMAGTTNCTGWTNSVSQSGRVSSFVQNLFSFAAPDHTAMPLTLSFGAPVEFATNFIQQPCSTSHPVLCARPCTDRRPRPGRGAGRSPPLGGLQPTVEGGVAALNGSQIVLAWGATATGEYSDAVYQFDIGASMWSVLLESTADSAGIPGRAFSAGGEHDGRLVLFGGERSGTLYRDVVAITESGVSTLHNGESSLAPAAREAHSAVVAENRLWILGGRAVSGSQRTVLDDLWSFDLSGGATWREESPGGTAPVGRFFHSAAVLDGKMYVACGIGGSNLDVLSDLWSVSVAAGGAGSWVELASAPVAVNRHALVALNGQLALVMGARQDFVTESDSSDVHWFNVTTATWGETASTDLSSALTGFGAVAYDRSLVIVGGNSRREARLPTSIGSVGTCDYADPLHMLGTRYNPRFDCNVARSFFERIIGGGFNLAYAFNGTRCLDNVVSCPTTFSEWIAFSGGSISSGPITISGPTSEYE